MERQSLGRRLSQGEYEHSTLYVQLYTLLCICSYTLYYVYNYTLFSVCNYTLYSLYVVIHSSLSMKLYALLM